jgi:hypothetical protein
VTGSISLWRASMREPTSFATLLHATLASRAHNTTRAQTALTTLFLNLATRCARRLIGREDGRSTSG